jgi:hypothetical protein
MRSLVLFASASLAAAGHSLHKEAKCVIDGGEAASDLMDAAVFIWGAKQRCGEDGMKVKCQIDVASATQSVMSMTETILKIVGRCGHHFDPDLGRAVTRLIKAMAGLTAANGGIKQKCADSWKTPALDGMALPGKTWVHGGNALCVLDVKDSAKNLLKAIKYLVKMDKKCKHPGSHKCAKNAMKAVGALLGLGEWLTASIGDCHAADQLAHDAECSQEAISLVHHLVKVAEASMEIHWITHTCKKDSDCEAGEYCNHRQRNRECRPVPVCKVDADCREIAANFKCRGDRCVPPPRPFFCEKNSDCEADFICADRTCITPPVCTVNGDCDAGFTCGLKGRCAPVCTEDSECQEGLSCLEGQCGASIDQQAFGPWAPDAIFDHLTQDGDAEANRQIPRLYEDGMEKSEATPNYTNLVLGAFLPVTAIAAFLGGRFYSRQQTSTRVIDTAASIE